MTESYMSQEMRFKIEQQNKERIENLKKRILEFEKLSEIPEVKEFLANNFKNTDGQEVTEFNLGESKCVIINRDNFVRITLDTPEECISYDFV